MTLSTFQWLLSDVGQEALATLQTTPITPQTHLQIAAQLRERFTRAQVQLLLDTCLLREQAATKFSRAAQMVFTRPSLEQATAEPVARYRARRFAGAGLATIADLGCGIGGDALALAESANVIGIDRDPLRLAMARTNVGVYADHQRDHGRFQPLLADLVDLPPLAVDGLFFDPARRDERGRRIYSVHAYRPPLSLLDSWLSRVPHAGVKISPGVDYAELPPQAEVEFISLQGELKEAVLWFGALHSGVARRATLLPDGPTLTSADAPPAPVAAVPPLAILYEPDAAVIRAHLVQHLAHRLNAALIDPEIAYLTADGHTPTPFARAYAIEDHLPFQLKRLRHVLRERGIGRVTIKKRGSPLDPDVLQRQLRLQGDAERILFLTRVLGEPAVLIGRPLD